jgi:hypothetical protein
MFVIRERLFAHPVYYCASIFLLEFLPAMNTTYSAKAIPLEAWIGPEGSRRLRLPDFKTSST